jgi:EF hand domain-containing protein
MRYLPALLCVAIMAACGGCAMNPTTPEPGTAGQNTTKTMAPADEQASKPGNSGNGLGYTTGDTDAAARAFARLDVNHDGFVSGDEFVTNGDSGQRFPGCDSDGDGKLALAEFLACAQRPATTGQ